MAEGKKKAIKPNPIKLEQEFSDFKKEWEKFLNNHFAHVEANVNTLVKECSGINTEMKSIKGDVKSIHGSMQEMNKKIDKALGAQAYEWTKAHPKK